jgi:DNA polymerase
LTVPVPPPLAQLLAYLDDLGYGELYLPRRGAAGAGGPVDAATAARSAAGAGGRPAPRTAPPLRSPAGASPALASPPASAGPSPSTASGALEGPPPARWSTLAEVDAVAQQCTACALARGRRTVVFGVGDPDADLMLIGEGPGAEEDRRGEPFVGPAGQLLDKIIAAIGLTREQVYIANVVKCRPPGNRDPLPEEVAACRAYLDAQIDLVRPKAIVALGRVAAQSLLGNDLPLGRLRGVWHKVRGVDLRVTYHPAGLLRNPNWKRPCWEDMQIVRDRLLAS